MRSGIDVFCMGAKKLGATHRTLKFTNVMVADVDGPEAHEPDYPTSPWYILNQQDFHP